MKITVFKFIHVQYISFYIKMMMPLTFYKLMHICTTARLDVIIDCHCGLDVIYPWNPGNIPCVVTFLAKICNFPGSDGRFSDRGFSVASLTL